MKKLITAVFLSLSLTSISCEETKQENTPWYASYKKTVDSGAAYTALYMIMLNSQVRCTTNPKTISLANLEDDLSYGLKAARYAVMLSIAPSLIIASIGKLIHNRNQNKKMKNFIK